MLKIFIQNLYHIFRHLKSCLIYLIDNVVDLEDNTLRLPLIFARLIHHCNIFAYDFQVCKFVQSHKWMTKGC